MDKQVDEQEHRDAYNKNGKRADRGRLDAHAAIGQRRLGVEDGRGSGSAGEDQTDVDHVDQRGARKRRVHAGGNGERSNDGDQSRADRDVRAEVGGKHAADPGNNAGALARNGARERQRYGAHENDFPADGGVLDFLEYDAGLSVAFAARKDEQDGGADAVTAGDRDGLVDERSELGADEGVAENADDNGQTVDDEDTLDA